MVTVIKQYLHEKKTIKYKVLGYNLLHFAFRGKGEKSNICFTDGKKHKACEFDMITHDLECPRHDYNCVICSYDVKGADFKYWLNAFGQSEKS